MVHGDLLSMFTELDGGSISSDKLLAVLRADKKAAMAVDPATGNTPLHFATCNGAPIKVVAALLEATKGKAASIVSLEGDIPLVGAVANGATLEIVHALLAAYPEGVKHCPHGQTPLHFACCHGQPQVVRALLEAWPGAAAVKDAEGNYPLHFAAIHGRSAAIVKELLAAHPDAASKQGHWDRLPLALAVLNGAPANAVIAIRDAYPDALRDVRISNDYMNGPYGDNSMA